MAFATSSEYAARFPDDTIATSVLSRMLDEASDLIEGELAPRGIDYENPSDSYADKLALFRARFACRADAWARRWTSRGTGRSGFSPACGNEWRPGFCLKPSKRCSACHNRAWLPLTDEIVRWHLLGATPSGKSFALGGYPILIGDDTRVAALHCPADRADARSPDMRCCARGGSAAG